MRTIKYLAGVALIAFPGLSTAIYGQEAAPAAPEVSTTVRLKQVEIRDPGMNDMVSHRLLLPEGWQLSGGVAWTPGLKPFVHNQFGLVAPDGRELWFLPGHLYSFAEIPPGLQQQMRMQGNQMPQPGTPQHDGSIWMPPPQNCADFVTRNLIPRGRPQARDVKVVEVTHLEEVERAFRQQLAPLIQQFEQQQQMMAQQGMRGDLFLRFECVAVEYTENGIRFREEVSMLLFAWRMITPDPTGMMGGPIVNYHWHALPYAVCRAPAESFKANEALFVTLAGNVQPTMEWQIRIHELQMEISRIEHEGRMAAQAEFQKRQQIIADTNRDISEMQMASWRERQESSDRVQRSFINTIRDVDDFRTPDGSSVSLPSHYDRVFTDTQGNYILTNDHLFDPNRHDTQGGWQTIERIRPSGGAAND